MLSNIIMINIMLPTFILVALLNCLYVVMELLSHYICNLKLRKSIFLDLAQQLVGINMIDEGNTLEDSNKAVFVALTAPKHFQTSAWSSGCSYFIAHRSCTMKYISYPSTSFQGVGPQQGHIRKIRGKSLIKYENPNMTP